MMSVNFDMFTQGNRLALLKQIVTNVSLPNWELYRFCLGKLQVNEKGISYLLGGLGLFLFSLDDEVL